VIADDPQPAAARAAMLVSAILTGTLLAAAVLATPLI
jgi:hypothetical protein